MKKLIFIMLIISLGYSVIADKNASAPVATAVNNEESTTAVLLAEQDSRSPVITIDKPKSSDVLSETGESKAPNDAIATSTQPVITESKTEKQTTIEVAHKDKARDKDKEKGIISTFLGWFSSSPEEEKIAEQSRKTAAPAKKKSQPVIIGLALGGGAAKGFAHIGVIKALEEHGIRPKVITGTSASSNSIIWGFRFTCFTKHIRRFWFINGYYW